VVPAVLHSVVASKRHSGIVTKRLFCPEAVKNNFFCPLIVIGTDNRGVYTLPGWPTDSLLIYGFGFKNPFGVFAGWVVAIFRRGFRWFFAIGGHQRLQMAYNNNQWRYV